MTQQRQAAPRMPALVLLLLLLGATLASAAWKLSGSPPRPPAVGQRAPSFTLPDLAGGSYSLDQWRGQRVLLVFWAPWSPPALAQARSLRQAVMPAGVVLVDVALDYVDLDEVRTVVGQNGGERVHLLGRPTELAAWGTFPTLPAAWLLDAEGRVRATREGYLAPAALARLAATP